MRTLLLVGLIATTAWAQAPDSVAGKIYHESSSWSGDVVYDQLYYSSSATVLHADGSYSTFYRVTTGFAVGSGEPKSISVEPTDAGTYTYSKTGGVAATLTLSSTQGLGVRERNLAFEDGSGGILVGSPLSGGLLGDFSFSSVSDAPVVNVSARGTASAGEPLILGFYVSSRPRLVLVRGVGPTLSQFDVTNAAEDTTIEIVPSQPLSGNAVVLGSWNDDWEVNTNSSVSYSPGPVSPVESVGAFTGAFALPAGSKDAALVLELQPGAYTAIIRNKSETPAEVLGEVYIVP